MAARARMIRMWRAGFEMRWGLRRDDFFAKVQGGRGDEEELPSVPGAVGLRRTEGCASALLAFGSVITPPGRFSKSGVGIALLWFSWTSESKSRPEHFHSLMEWTAGREKLGMIRSVPPSGRRGAAWGCSFLDLSVEGRAIAARGTSLGLYSIRAARVAARPGDRNP